MPKSPIEKLGSYSDKSVLKNTGKSWRQWVDLLNKEGAAHLTHKEIVALLKKKYKLTPWWQQGVTSGYEIHIGRRIEGQNQKGEYSMTATKTFPVDQKTLWKILTSVEGQAVWLAPLTTFPLKPKQTFEVRGGIFGAVRTVKAPERMRLSWQDTDWAKPTIVTVQIHPRPAGKCMLGLQHDALKDARLKEQLRTRWKKAIEDLLAYVLKEYS